MGHCSRRARPPRPPDLAAELPSTFVDAGISGFPENRLENTKASSSLQLGTPLTPTGARKQQLVAIAARTANRVARFCQHRIAEATSEDSHGACRLHRHRQAIRANVAAYTVDKMHLQLDNNGPKYEQLSRALRQAIRSGQLQSGGKLPSTRMLSEKLGLSRNTVLRAYEQLRIERLGVMREGSGTYVSDVPLSHGPVAPPKRVEAQSAYASRVRDLPPLTLAGPRPGLRYDLQYGAPLVNTKLVSAWSTALATAAARTNTGNLHPQGLPELRESISRFLAIWRGVVANPQDIVIVSGTQQALSLVARIILDVGATAAIEDPHYQLALHCLLAHGADVTGVRTDEEGLVVDELPKNARLIHVTPSHQFPSGKTMSLSRRRQLLKFAEENSSWIFEDDYDGELSYSAKPIAALRSLDAGDRVVYVGSFSKMMFPALRLAYVVCPAGLRKDLIRAKTLEDLGCPSIEQAAMHLLFERGAFDRHLRATVVELRRRRSALFAGLERHAGGRIQVVDSQLGMHVVGWLPDFDPPKLDRLIASARLQGLGLHPIHPYYRAPPPQLGLLLGFASMFPRQIEVATKILGDCLRALP
jgi:GntR family transcriptional regulator/MocR family aminotransferase